MEPIMRYLYVIFIIFLIHWNSAICSNDTVDNPFKNSLFGVDCSLSPDDNTFPVDSIELVVKRLDEMGIKWIRETFMQSGIEYPRGVYHWEEYDEIIRLWQKYNFQIVACIYGGSNYTGPMRDGTDKNRLVPRYNGIGNCKATLEEWWEYVQKTVERYDGDGINDMPGLKYPIKYWESWNEPNQVTDPGHDGFWYRKWADSLNTEDMNYLYVLQKGFYSSVKQADSTSLVIGPSVLSRGSYDTDHRKEFYCTESQSYYDIINYHKNRLYSWKNWDKSISCMSTRKVWFTETSRHKLDGENEYENNIEYIKLLIQGGYLIQNKIMRIYHYFDQKENNKYIDITAPGYPLKQMGIFMKTLFSQLDKSEPQDVIEHPNWVGYKFGRKDGRVYAMWSREDSAIISFPVATKNVQVVKLDGSSKWINVHQSRVNITLSEEPIFLFQARTDNCFRIQKPYIQNYPNPFNAETKFEYQISNPGNYSINIYNEIGQRVRVLKNNFHDKGNYSVIWDATDQASGIYFCELAGEGVRHFCKILFLK
jgi:flagellar hook assembly protein FlgD